MAVPNWKEERFVSFGGPTVRFSMEDEAGPYLQHLAEQFPKEFSRALRHAAWLLTRRLKATMRSGKIQGGASLPERALITQNSRIERLKNGSLRNLKKRSGWVQYELTETQRKHLGNIGGRFTMLSGKYTAGSIYNRFGQMTRKDQYIPDARLRWGKSPKQVAGIAPKMARFIRYKQLSPVSLAVGAQNPTTARYLEAVQSGRRGSRGGFEYMGRQKVTPAMRRMFFLAGIPLRKDAVLEQKPRPFVREVFEKFRPELSDVIVTRITAIMHGLTGKKMDKYQW